MYDNSLATVNNSTETGLSFDTIMTIYVVVAIICGVVAALIARHNDRSPMFAFVAGFFFGPLGVMTYMIMGESLELRAEIKGKPRNEKRH